MIGKWIVVLFLIVGSVWDLRNKSIPGVYLYVWSLVAIVYAIFDMVNGKNVLEIIIALIPGVVGLILSFVTREQIGLGDGIVILLAGFFMGVKDVFGMVIAAFLVLTLVTIFLLVMHRVNGKSKIPFIPFLFVGHLICVWGGEFI